jgi:tripartite-type tricarboxylate transporter receptor subunit TctC
MKRILLAALLAAFAGAVASQPYPSRPVRIVVPFAAGSTTDTITRAVGVKLAESLGQPVVVDNRAGASGAIAADHVAKSAPDGYSVLVGTTSTHVIVPLTAEKVTYDAQKDFAPVSLLALSPNLLIVSPALPVATVRDFVAYAKARPGQLNFASSGNGSITHLFGELFNASAGIQATHVPYKTGMLAMPDVMSGQIAYQIDSIVWSLPQVRAGKIKALAITTARRSALAPDLPTVAESGYPGFEAVTWLGLFAPAGTPAPVVQKLSGEVTRVVDSAEMKATIAKLGAEAASSTPQELARLVREETPKWGEVVRKVGLKRP